MDTAPTGPELASAAPPHACPHCGAGCAGAGAADPTATITAMLTELASYNLRMMRIATEQAEAVGRLDPEQAMVMEVVSRSTRRTLALTAKLHADSTKTPEERAADRAERAARAERARLREKMGKVVRGAEAVIQREAEPSDRENLLGDMHFRLQYADIDIALAAEDVSAIVLRVLKDVGIAPKGATMSDALMAHEITAAHAELDRAEAELAAGRAAVAAGADWREGVEFSSWPADRASDSGDARGPPGAG